MESDPVDLLPDGVVIAGPDGRVQVCNQPAATLLGWERSATIGRPIEEVLALTDHDGRGWTEIHRPYLGYASRTAVPEQSWLAPDGTEVLITARLHRDRPRGRVQTLAVGLRSGRGRERLDRERSDLVATVAHELRSPLTGVKGFVTALLNRWDRLNDEQKKLMLTTVATDADRLSRLITELLDVARIDTGRLQLHRRATGVAQKAERVVASARVATSRSIELDIEQDARIDADPDKVIQVLTNLVENGLRHGAGTVRVRVGLGHSVTEAAMAEVTVSDEGPGIPVELRRRVFTKFWTGSTGGGSGLGLYIVHGLVTAHGGTITIDDEPTGGARITTTWPLAVEDSGQESARQPGASPE